MKMIIYLSLNAAYSEDSTWAFHVNSRHYCACVMLMYCQD